jgi:hypothetical protein
MNCIIRIPFISFIIECLENPFIANCTVGAKGPSPLRKTTMNVVMDEFVKEFVGGTYKPSLLRHGSY